MPQNTLSSSSTFDRCSGIIYRKTDSETNTTTSGYVLLMSYTYDETSSKAVGFYKGARTPGTDAYVDHLRESAQEIIHPMLLPIIILSSRIGPRQEGHQREARAKLRLVEEALLEHMQPSGSVSMNLESINANLVVS